MAKRPTPIERAIAGESPDRQRRYLDRLEAKGFTRITVTVPRDGAARVHALAQQLRAAHEAGHD